MRPRVLNYDMSLASLLASFPARPLLLALPLTASVRRDIRADAGPRRFSALLLFTRAWSYSYMLASLYFAGLGRRELALPLSARSLLSELPGRAAAPLGL